MNPHYQNGVVDRVQELQRNHPKINPQLTPEQLVRAIVGPILTYVVQEKIFQIPGSQTDHQVISQQIIASLTLKWSLIETAGIEQITRCLLFIFKILVIKQVSLAQR